MCAEVQHCTVFTTSMHAVPLSPRCEACGASVRLHRGGYGWATDVSNSASEVHANTLLGSAI